MTRTSVPTNRQLEDGRRLRIRPLRPSDHARLAELVERTGPHDRSLDMRDLLHFDPRERTVLCATVWTGQSAALVGYTAGHRDGGGPDIVLADEEAAPGVGRVLEEILGADIRARDQRAA